MTVRDWRRRDALMVGVFLNGEALLAETPQGEQIFDDSFLLLFNAYYDAVGFTLPPRRFGLRWELVLSTFEPDAEAATFPARGLVHVEGRSIVLLRRVAR